jgi:hypothetical protein
MLVSIVENFDTSSPSQRFRPQHLRFLIAHQCSPPYAFTAGEVDRRVPHKVDAFLDGVLNAPFLRLPSVHTQLTRFLTTYFWGRWV